jgi:hypothetical protein
MKHFWQILLSLAALAGLSLACALVQPVETPPRAVTVVVPATMVAEPPATATSTEVEAPTQPAAPATAAPVPTVVPPVIEVTSVTVYLVALEDKGKNGIAVGCGDSLVPIVREVPPTTEPVKAALEMLFSYKSQFIGESGLYTALYQSDLKVQNVQIGAEGTAWVELVGQYMLGGMCDDPRFQGQIEQTILTAAGASKVQVTINGKPLKEIVSNK